jgi:uncharacterized protein YfaT (DUF1175 family)
MVLWLGRRPTQAEEHRHTAEFLSGNIGRNVHENEWQARRDANVAFEATRPEFKEGCLACGRPCGWEAAANEDGKFWICAGCHRPKMTLEQAQAELAQRRAEDEQRAAAAAAATTPAATRAALQAAAERHREDVGLVAKLEVGKRRLVDLYWEAFSERAAAEAQLTAIRSSTAEAIIEIALGDVPASPSKTVRQAEADLEDADLRLSNAKNAQASIEARLTEAKTRLSWRADRLRSAATAAIGAQSAAWLRQFAADTAKMQAQLADRRHALTWLRKNGMVDDDATVKELALNFEVAPHAWQVPEGSVGTFVSRWETAVTALCADPAKAARAQLA